MFMLNMYRAKKVLSLLQFDSVMEIRGTHCLPLPEQHMCTQTKLPPVLSVYIEFDFDHDYQYRMFI